MLLTSRQAAQKLGVHISTITKLVKEEKLKDYGTPMKEGGKIHHLKIQSKELNEFAKNYKIHSFRSPHSNNHTEPSSPGQISLRLTHIEEKLDQLIRMWS